MPLKECQINGEKGWKWGDSGHCYKSKEDAMKQARAIERSKHLQSLELNINNLKIIKDNK